MGDGIHYLEGTESDTDCRWPWSITQVTARNSYTWDKPGHTIYGVNTSEGATVDVDAGRFTVGPLMFFSAVPPVEVKGFEGIVIRREGYEGVFSLGGPIEERGRLNYIDGCTDSLLIHPPRCGDPCLNHLSFPPGIRQTMHTHPSVRLGLVVRGRGVAVTPDYDLELKPGVPWVLPPGSEHCFFTDDVGMDIIAWHPDSDSGPRDEDHPMLNRTFVEGVSVSERSDLWTGADG